MDNNDFILKIVAELEQNGIKTGFDKLKKELEKDPAKIDVILDTSGTVGKTKGSIKKLAAELHNELSVEINKLQKQGQDINFDLSVGDVEEVIQNVINHTKKLGESFDVASDKAQKFLAKFNKKSGGVLINSEEFKAVQEAINGLGDTHTIDDLNKAMNTLEVTYDNMSSKLRNSGKSLNPFINAKNEMATMDKTIEGISLEFEKLASKPEDVSKAIKELSVQQDKVNSYSVGTMEWADAYGHLQEMIRNVTKDISNLQKAQSAKSLQPQVDKIQLLSNGGIENDYSTQIAKLEGNFRSLGLTEDEIQKKTSNVVTAFNTLKTRINQPFDESNYKEIISLNDKLQKELIESSNEYTKLQSSSKGFVSVQQRLSKANIIEAWNQKNSAATKEVISANEAYIASLRDLNSQMTKMQFNEIVDGFKKSENSMRSLGRLGASFNEQMSQAAQSFTQWLSVSSVVMLAVSKTRNAVSELKEINTILTEISKANDKLSKSDLNNIGNNSFDIASKYGKTATNYLAGVQEASRAGYENAMGIAELSVAAQGAGDMTAELANQYIIATDKAYKLGGSVEKLMEVLDGSNYITNHNAVNMTELAEGMSIVGSQAASLGVKVNETTAVLGTMIATTQQSGSEMARAFKAILLNIQQVTDEEEGIDAEGLTKYEKACNALNVSLKETKNGIISLRKPMEVLKDLAYEYSKLDSNDIRRTNLLSSVGGKLRANALNAILENYDMYEKMLREYANGTGSMAAEAEKTAKSWEGSMNRLSNTWTDTVENIANSDAIISAINGLNGLLSVVNNITDKLDSLGTIGLSAGLFTGLKNFGKVRECVHFNFCFEYALSG